MLAAVLPAAVLPAAVLPAAAQTDSARDAEALDLALGAAVPVGEAYDGLWAAGQGAALRLAIPFHGGTGHVGLHAFPNGGSRPNLPDFLALHAQGGWGYPLRLPGGMRLTGGALVGALHMRFDDEDRFSGALRNETELTAGLFARLDVPVAGPARAFVAGEALRVYTFERIDLRFVQAGVSATVISPEWLRRVLR